MPNKLLNKERFFVGSYQPIKLKVSVKTDAIPTTYIYLNPEGDPYDGITESEPFNPIKNPDWKNLNEGEIVQGKTLLVITYFKFYNSFINEEAFQLAIDQIETTFQIQIMSDISSHLDLDFSVEFEYASKTCLISTETSLV